MSVTAGVILLTGTQQTESHSSAAAFALHIYSVCVHLRQNVLILKGYRAGP